MLMMMAIEVIFVGTLRHISNVHNTPVTGLFIFGRLPFSTCFHKMNPSAPSLIDGNLNKMDSILQTTFSSAFCWDKSVTFSFKFHWTLFPRAQLTIRQHGFRSWCRCATSHYMNQRWPRSTPPDVVSRPGRVKTRRTRTCRYTQLIIMVTVKSLI